MISANSGPIFFKVQCSPPLKDQTGQIHLPGSWNIPSDLLLCCLINPLSKGFTWEQHQLFISPLLQLCFFFFLGFGSRRFRHQICYYMPCYWEYQSSPKSNNNDWNIGYLWYCWMLWAWDFLRFQDSWKIIDSGFSVSRQIQRSLKARLKGRELLNCRSPRVKTSFGETVLDLFPFHSTSHNSQSHW